MYRSKTIEEISGMVTIYDTMRYARDAYVDTVKLQGYIDNPTLPRLIRILKEGNDGMRKAVLTSIGCGVNFTSVKPFLSNDFVLLNIFRDIDISPIYSVDDVLSIVRYSKTKGTNTNRVAKQQMDDVADFFSRNMFIHDLSGSGFTDIDYTGRKAAAKADGLVSICGHDILVYMRYGSSAGGSQSDRWRQMFSSAYMNMDRRFLFVVDGVEALQQYGLCLGEFRKYEYPNAIWTTVKYLEFIDFDIFEML